MSDSPFFRRLPGSLRAASGLEQRVWRRLPALLFWGTLLPLLLAGLNHWLAPAATPTPRWTAPCCCATSC